MLCIDLCASPFDDLHFGDGEPPHVNLEYGYGDQNQGEDSYGGRAVSVVVDDVLCRDGDISSSKFVVLRTIH